MRHGYFQSARELQIEAANIEAAKRIGRMLARSVGRERAVAYLRDAGLFEAEIEEVLQ